MILLQKVCQAAWNGSAFETKFPSSALDLNPRRILTSQCRTDLADATKGSPPPHLKFPVLAPVNYGCPDGWTMAVAPDVDSPVNAKNSQQASV